jgi:hypothetical protein
MKNKYKILAGKPEGKIFSKDFSEDGGRRWIIK